MQSPVYTQDSGSLLWTYASTKQFHIILWSEHTSFVLLESFIAIGLQK